MKTFAENLLNAWIPQLLCRRSPAQGETVAALQVPVSIKCSPSSSLVQSSSTNALLHFLRPSSIWSWLWLGRGRDGVAWGEGKGTPKGLFQFGIFSDSMIRSLPTQDLLWIYGSMIQSWGGEEGLVGWVHIQGPLRSWSTGRDELIMVNKRWRQWWRRKTPWSRQMLDNMISQTFSDFQTFSIPTTTLFFATR